MGHQEPVAWAILHKEHQYVSLLREHAEAHNVYVDAKVIPLYRSPDAERLANARLSAANVALIAERDSLREAIRRLLDNINDRYPTKNPREWSCPHMQALDDMTYGAVCRKQPTLTDEEREAVQFMLRHAASGADCSPYPDSADYDLHHDVIFRMLHRLGGNDG